MTLRNLYIGPKSRYLKSGTFDGFQYLTKDMEIVQVTSRGKKIIFILKRSDGVTVYLVSFLGMEGHWVYTPENHTSIILEIANIRKVGGRTIVSGNRYVYMDDTIHYGSIQAIVTEAEFKHVFKAVGPDFLRNTITIQDYTTVIRKPRLRNKDLASFLLDQSKFSGVGNYLRAEIMFEAKVAPQRLLGTLTDQEITLLHYYTIKIIRDSTEKGGLTIATYKAPNGNTGTYNHKVYSKDRDPAGNPVLKYKDKANRMVHWVPNIQV